MGSSCSEHSSLKRHDWWRRLANDFVKISYTASYMGLYTNVPVDMLQQQEVCHGVNGVSRRAVDDEQPVNGGAAQRVEHVEKTAFRAHIDQRS